jgi:uncharacterized protein
MTIREQLADELKEAMRAQDRPRRDVIRQVETAISQARSEPGFSGEIDDALYLQVIGSYVKKMDKARKEYADLGERGEEMATKLQYEIDYLGRWLPSKLDETATREVVRAAISELGVAGDDKSAGLVTGHVMKTSEAELDGGLVSRIVREELAGG